MYQQALKQKIAQEEAKAKAEQDKWENKRAAERPLEVPAPRTQRIDLMTQIVSSWDNMVASRVYAKEGMVKEEGAEEDIEQIVRDMFATFIRKDLNGEAMDCYEENKKDGSHHGMWVPKLKPTLAFN